MRKIGLYALELLVSLLFILGLALPVRAADGPTRVEVDDARMDPRTGPVDPAFRTDALFENPPSRQVLDSNTEGNEPTNGNYSNIPGDGTGTAGRGGKISWWKDHGKGLLLGALEGIGIAVGVVAVGALLAISAPIVGAAAIGALVGAAAYGAFAGASNFNPWECAVNGVIGAVSGGIGTTLGAASVGIRALVTGAVDAIGSGIASVAAYGLNTGNPTAEGYLSAFGVGALIGGATFGLSRLVGIGQRARGVLQGRSEVLGTTAREGRAVTDAAVKTKLQVTARLAGSAGPEAQERILADVAESADAVGYGATRPAQSAFTETVDAATHNGIPVKEFDIVPYRPVHQGLEGHHGVLDVWALHNIPGYVSREASSPTIALTPKNHDATKRVYRQWLFERTGKKVGGAVDWSTVSAREAQDLSEQMFDAAGVPVEARRAYYKAFHGYVYEISPL